MSKETLELQFNSLRGEWYLRDMAGAHIGTMAKRSDAEKYALDMGYRLCIHKTRDINEKPEWFN